MPQAPSLAHPFAVDAPARLRIRSSAAAATTRIEVLSGRDAILSRAGLLEELAGCSEQPGAMHGLDYLLDHEYAARKNPHLVLFTEKDDRHPFGAALFFEYRIGFWSTGFFSTGDNFGVRTVIGPEQLRPSIAVEACKTLLQHRPGMVLASFKQEPLTAPVTAPVETPADNSSTCLWFTQSRLVQDHLPLAGTVDATLARLGKRTRTHLRYYRRKLQEAVPCDFYADVRPLIDPADTALLARLNQTSLEPVAQEIFNLQYRSAVLSPDGFVSGLRSKDGQWLALVGGWRQGGTTWVQWQTNTAAFPSLSLGTALRLFLMEQEVARGARTLAFHGGTSHSMRHAFPSERVVDLVARRGVLPALLTRLLPALHRLVPSLAIRGNFLADALPKPGLRWTNKPLSSHSQEALS